MSSFVVLRTDSSSSMIEIRISATQFTRSTCSCARKKRRAQRIPLCGANQLGLGSFMVTEGSTDVVRSFTDSLQADLAGLTASIVMSFNSVSRETPSQVVPSFDHRVTQCISTGDGFGGQIAERFPIPSSQNLVAFLDRKFPLIERHAWRRPSRQDWKISRDVLARRQLCICGTAPTGKAS